jgi:hypothetical protein
MLLAAVGRQKAGGQLKTRQRCRADCIHGPAVAVRPLQERASHQRRVCDARVDQREKMAAECVWRPLIYHLAIL